MVVVKNNVYYYGFEFVVKIFLKVEINIFSIILLNEVIWVRKIVFEVIIFLMNFVYDFDLVKCYDIYMIFFFLNYYYKYK